MNRQKRMLVLAFPIIVLAAGFVGLKHMIPLEYAEANLRPDALQYVKRLQEEKSLSAMETAKAYIYLGTDYQAEIPSRIIINETQQRAGLVRINFYDPSVRDDSIFETRTRIYLRQNTRGFWVPVKHTWSHKGRGRLGWTTKSTI